MAQPLPSRRPSTCAAIEEAHGRTPCILVVDDDVLTGLRVEEILFGLGFDTQLCHRVEAALTAAANESLAYGFIDVNLDGYLSGLAVADILERRGVPFVLATGCARQTFGGRHEQASLLRKPYDFPEIQRVLHRAGLLPASDSQRIGSAGPGAV